MPQPNDNCVKIELAAIFYLKVSRGVCPDIRRCLDTGVFQTGKSFRGMNNRTSRNTAEEGNHLLFFYYQNSSNSEAG